MKSDCFKTKFAEVKLVLPILTPYPVVGYDESFIQSVLDEIKDLRGSFHCEWMNIEYEVCSRKKRFSSILKKVSPKRFGFNKIFCLLFRANFDTTKWTSLKIDEKITWTPYENFIVSFLSEVENFCKLFALALGISSRGAFDVDDHYICYNNRNNQMASGCLNGYGTLLLDYCSASGFSQRTSLQETLDWMLSIEDAVNEYGKTALGKSLSVFSRMFCSFSDGDDFFLSGLLAVIALEALYESHGSKNVLCDKMAAFLEIDKKKIQKNVNEIYKHRSEIAHGGFEMPFLFSIFDGSDNYERSMHVVWENMAKALDLLFTSYYKMIRLKKRELIFEYKVK